MDLGSVIHVTLIKNKVNGLVLSMKNHTFKHEKPVEKKKLIRE